jgi:uncharacterized coiled-coil protein SlyX
MAADESNGRVKLALVEQKVSRLEEDKADAHRVTALEGKTMEQAVAISGVKAKLEEVNGSVSQIDRNVAVLLARSTREEDAVGEDTMSRHRPKRTSEPVKAAGLVAGGGGLYAVIEALLRWLGG